MDFLLFFCFIYDFSASIRKKWLPSPIHQKLIAYFIGRIGSHSVRTKCRNSAPLNGIGLNAKRTECTSVPPMKNIIILSPLHQLKHVNTDFADSEKWFCDDSNDFDLNDKERSG